MVENYIGQNDQLIDQLHHLDHHHLFIQIKIHQNIIQISYQLLVRFQREPYLFSYHEFENGQNQFYKHSHLFLLNNLENITTNF